jgi:hypothetical protein
MSVDTRGAKPTPDQLFRWFPDDRWALWLIDGRRPTDSRLLLREEWGLGVHADAQWHGSLLAVPRRRAGEVGEAIERVASHQ